MTKTLVATEFNVLTDDLSPRSIVCVLGNCKQLGNWDLTKSIPLEKSVDSQNNEQLIWSVKVDLPESLEVEYKYVIKENGFIECWETLPINRKFVVSSHKNLKESQENHEKKQKKENEKNIVSKFGFVKDHYRNKWIDHDLLVDETLIILQMDLEGEEILPGISLDEDVLPEAALSNTKKENREQFQVILTKRIQKKKISSKEKEQEQQKEQQKQSQPNPNKWRSYSVLDTDIYQYRCALNNKESFDFTILFQEKELVAKTTLSNNSLKNNSGKIILPLFDLAHELVGELTFRHYKVLPFRGKRKKHNNLSNIFRTYWSPKTDQVYIGHRGSGSNKGWSRVQENSILSFQLAQNSKVSDWIEFDVQLTKDHKVVIAHDFHVTIKQETNTLKIPICKMTEKEFFSHRQDSFASIKVKNTSKHKKINKSENLYKLVGNNNKNNNNNNNNNNSNNNKNNNKKKENNKKKNNNQNNNHINKNNNTKKNYLGLDDIPDKFVQKKTQSNKKQKIKSKSSTDIFSLLEKDPKKQKNGEEKEQQNEQKLLVIDRFINLDHIFQQLKNDLNFNIEIKYPYTFTSEKELNYPDRNVVVDKVLDVVLKYSKGKTPKRIIFSSFDPIICLMVHWKQPKFPVFFLNHGGRELYENPLMNSLEHALHFSSKSRFKGIVCFTEPLLDDLTYVQRVHEHNLVLFTYGDQNNDKKYLEIQKNLKVDGIIGDKVAKINLKSTQK
ncbi:glycerophosphoryl diester phosphodiesterase [Anaeramoeba flamelloides]|uniref:Glycerophosphoryl diester phosphodiesterase n=1 Tax=Anaeramoeba flamelloides TaxID=1746091 RepID=A0ABQ8YDM0_9EUKA|nr:glycerophosphoryl diester phosphodiesterase [Anaeramoeba flamelloides]